MLNISASSNTRHRYDIKLYNCSMPLHSHPSCRDAPQGPISSKYCSGWGRGDGCLERWGTMHLLGSNAGSATSPEEAVPRELLKHHFISKQGPGDLLCEGLDAASGGAQNKETGPQAKNKPDPRLVVPYCSTPGSGWRVPSISASLSRHHQWGIGVLGFICLPLPPVSLP